MVNEEFDKQAQANAWGLPATFSEALLKGKDIPEKFNKYYWGFDFEIQLSNLSEEDLDYLNVAFEQINALAIKIYEIETLNKYKDKDTSLYQNWCDEINSEVKVIIRGRRGLNALTVKESRTIRSHGEQLLEERNRERAGWFSRFIGGKGVRK